MAASPEFKLYDAAGAYQAACKQPEQAAALVSFLGDGATIRYGHTKKDIVWTEGVDGAASDSYDQTANKVVDRLFARSVERQRQRDFDRWGGERRLYPLD
jgi:hypothetical protein